MNVLNRICADKKDHIRARQAETPLIRLEDIIKDKPATYGFIDQIRNKAKDGQTALITEVKKASPSKGVIREDFDPVAIARTYSNSGAACLSVLTDEPYFQGHDEYLAQIRQAVNLPLLRKDFMIDPYQIYESRALGADCILLIMAALSDSQAAEFYNLAEDLSLDVLVEVHDETELERALDLNPAMIGVNNRNLATLEVDINTARRLAGNIPAKIVKIAESGIHTRGELTGLKACGYQGFLVGESLMRQENIAQAVKNLIA